MNERKDGWWLVMMMPAMTLLLLVFVVFLLSFVQVCSFLCPYNKVFPINMPVSFAWHTTTGYQLFKPSSFHTFISDTHPFTYCACDYMNVWVSGCCWLVVLKDFFGVLAVIFCILVVISITVYHVLSI